MYNTNHRPGGAVVSASRSNAGPSGAFRIGYLESMGFRPWLTMSAPPGRWIFAGNRFHGLGRLATNAGPSGPLCRIIITTTGFHP
jgi:hypothetical protein